MTKAERADAVYSCFCAYLDGKGLRYKQDGAERTILLSMTGNDFPITLLLRVEEENERTFVFGKLPFDLAREKRVDLIMATTYINQVLAVGAYCVDGDYVSYESNEIYAGLGGFSLAYAERVIGGALSAIDAFNDKLFAVNKGLITVKEFASGFTAL